MITFSTFARTVAADFQAFAKKGEVFVVNVEGDALWSAYLKAFPEGADPMFRKRTEHDCSTCRQFVRHAGGAVSLANNTVSTVWDSAASISGPYGEVAKALQELVRGSGVRDIFRTSEARYGAAVTRTLDMETQKVEQWGHFHTGDLWASLRSSAPDTDRGRYRTAAQVFARGLVELTPEALDTVIDLIQSNSLYRGAEHLRAVSEFREMQRSYHATEEKQRQLFAWRYAGHPAARFRNTVIGTLVQDLSAGEGIDRAVASFEAKVAPTNYKRSSAVITPAMVKKAMATIEELGLESALERRIAVLSDVAVTDVKWVDGGVKSLMKGGIGDILMKHATAGVAAKDSERAEDISIEDFMAQVLPEAQSVELFFAGRHAGNLMVLTAPVHPEAKPLFRWNNNFAWSYGGNVTDSIAERVKAAGGKVDGVLRVSLSWFNYDDLDLHIMEPPGRIVAAAHGRIFFGAKRGYTGGVLDVDMNAGEGRTREAVENVVWERKMPDGPYQVIVNNYRQRENSDPGFVIEIANAGKVLHYSYNKAVRDRADVVVVTLHMKNGIIERAEFGDPGISSSAISQERWGLRTEQYVKVDTIMLSPNYWGDNATGNKHFFFVCDGARCEEEMRGIYNEFLDPRLTEHRKVFEVLADKTKCPVAPGMAGLGFSSTKPDEVRARVHQGKRQRVYNIYVGVS